jgi:hypothetical protein
MGEWSIFFSPVLSVERARSGKEVIIERGTKYQERRGWKGGTGEFRKQTRAKATFEPQVG